MCHTFAQDFLTSPAGSLSTTLPIRDYGDATKLREPFQPGDVIFDERPEMRDSIFLQPQLKWVAVDSLLHFVVAPTLAQIQAFHCPLFCTV